VLAGYLVYTEGNKADLIITGGDNSGNAGADADWVNTLNEMEVVTRNTPVMFAPGNHDWTAITGSDPALETGPWYDLLALPAGGEMGGTASLVETYYSFEYANIHVTVLDHQGSGTGGGGNTHYDWADTDLDANTLEWTIVVSHTPPYSKCKRDSDTDAQSIALRANWVAMLEGYGLDLYLTGHMHCYQRTWFINGHTGNNASWNAATHQVQPGSGGCCGKYYEKTGGGPVADSGSVYMIVASDSMTTGGTWDLSAAALTLNGACAGYTAPCNQNSAIIDIQDQLMDVHVIQQGSPYVRHLDHFQIRKTDP